MSTERSRGRMPLVVALPVAMVMACVALWQRFGFYWRLSPGRPATWYWRCWWRLGYLGLYQLDWRLKRA